MEYTRICPICGRSFVTHHVQVIYCGEECRVTARRKKDREAKAKTRAKLSEDRKRKQEPDRSFHHGWIPSYDSNPAEADSAGIGPGAAAYLYR